MDNEESEMLREIHRCLLGDLQTEGFIGETKHRLEKTEADINRFKWYFGSVLLPTILLIADKVAELVIK